MNSYETETLGTSRTGWEKFWHFNRIFFEEQGVHEKKMVCDSKFRWGRYDQNKLECSEFNTPQWAPIELKFQDGPTSFLWHNANN